MRLTLLVFIGIITGQLNVAAQDQSVGPAQLMARIRKSKPDTNRISLQITLGSYYLFKPGSYRKDMDSTIYYYIQALALSTKLHNSFWINQTLELIGDYEVENGNFEKGVLIIQQACAFYHRHNFAVNEAQTWERLGNMLDINGDATRPRQLLCYENALQLFTMLHKERDELRILLLVAYINIRLGRLDAAEKYCLLGLAKTGTKHNDSFEDFEFQLALVYNLKAIYHKALSYQLKLIGNQAAKSNAHTAGYWMQAAATYYLLGMYDKAFECNDKGLEGLEPSNVTGHINWLNNNVTYLLAQKKPLLALANVIKNVRKRPPVDRYQRASVLKNFGQCYAALGQNKLAEKYYEAMMEEVKRIYKNQKLDAFDIDRYAGAVYIATDFFISISEYKKAVDYFKLLNPYIDKKLIFIPAKLKVLRVKVKLDSVSGNYKKAFYDLTLYKKINDSVYNSTKSQQITEIQTQFESTQKEHAIKLLQSQSKTQNLELQTTQIERNITFGGIGILLLLTGLAFNRYRFKQKTNRELEEKQLEINIKNESLQRLITDKDHLITEKDWLIKEVHHRVKNNLQTVLSLLESQASFLRDDALTAIRTSQHRIYAMSLIHQKLYQGNHIKTIDIALYLQELIESLKDSFGTEGKITFNLGIRPLHMSVTQAIPVALIINEAVTNAIKYAFPNLRKGEININIKKTLDFIELEIYDNGIGIDMALLDKELTSLGLALIKGLATELKGELEIQNTHGTSVKIIFNCEEVESQRNSF